MAGRLGELRPDIDSPCGLSVPAEGHRPLADAGPALGLAAGDRDATGVPPLIVANQPTWGLDIGAVAYVHRQLLDACAAGAALLLISEDLDEIFALADRIAVMHHGRLTDARPAADWTLSAIGLAMAGVADATAADGAGNASDHADHSADHRADPSADPRATPVPPHAA